MEEKQKYIDMDGMQERVDAKHKDHLDSVWDGVMKKTDEVLDDNKKVQALFNKALQQELDEEERNAVKKMNADKEKALKEIEEQYGKKSTKAQVANQKDEDADLREMLRNIKYR